MLKIAETNRACLYRGHISVEIARLTQTGMAIEQHDDREGSGRKRRTGRKRFFNSEYLSKEL